MVKILKRFYYCFLTLSNKCLSGGEYLIQKSGLLIGGLLLFLVLLIGYDVVMRYIFHSGSVGAQELEWHLFSGIFLLGGAYTLQENNHVRVDVIYRSKLSNDKTKDIVDIFGTLFFLLPFCSVIIWMSTPFAYDAFIHGEISPDPGGLKYRWVVKSLIPLGFALLALQGLITLSRKLTRLY